MLCGLLLVHNLALGDGTPEAGQGERKLGLEDYMRFTPRPTPSTNETVSAPAIEPAVAPTQSPTQSPSQAPSTAAPTEAPSTLEPTKAPSQTPSTFAPTGAPSTLEPSEAPTEENVNGADETAGDAEAATPDAETTNTDTETTTAETEPPTEVLVKPVPEEEVWDQVLSTQEYENTMGSVSADFSLYSPNITNSEMNFEKVKLGVCGSINGLICDGAHSIAAQGPEYCAVLDEVLLTDGVSRALQQVSDPDATVIALGSTFVKDDSGVVQGLTQVSWTTWRVTWDVLRLGPKLREHIQETFGADLEEAEITKKGVTVLQQMMTVNMDRTLRDGALQKDINNFMVDIMLITSFVGEEVKTYEPLVAPPPDSTAQSGLENETGEDGDGGGLMVVLFFAGLGVACFVIVALLYFSFRSRRSKLRRKRTIVILDDTSKESGGTPQGAKKGDKQGAPQEAQESAQEKMAVMEPEGALEEDPPQGQQEEGDQQWEEESMAEDVGEADVESQWGRSAAQSSAYTGSISAITGVSGLEQSDTWSVGSMSIDLAEWG